MNYCDILVSVLKSCFMSVRGRQTIFLDILLEYVSMLSFFVVVDPSFYITHKLIFLIDSCTRGKSVIYVYIHGLILSKVFRHPSA